MSQPLKHQWENLRQFGYAHTQQGMMPSPLSPKPFVTKLDAGGRWCCGWGIRDALAPLAYDCFWVVPRQSGGERRPESQSISIWHTTEKKTQDWLCSLEDIPVPDLSQFSPVNLQKDYYQLCPQQPHRNLGNVCPCSFTQGWHALWSSSMLRQGISAQQINTATINGINYSLMELCLVSQTESIIWKIFWLKNAIIFLIGFIFPAMIFQNTIYKGLGKEVT